MDKISLPVDSGYFTACIESAEKTGLKLLGRAAVDSENHVLRKQTLIHGTDIPVVALKRVTTLFFSFPGKAFLLGAAFHEELKHDFERAHSGERVTKPWIPFWKLHVFLGAHPGVWWGDDSGWVHLPQHFEGDKLRVLVLDDRDKHPGDCSHGSCGPADRDAEVQDGVYDILLGYYPDEPTPRLFAQAIANMMKLLQPHIRPGKLGLNVCGSSVFAIPPWINFSGCEDSFWSQCPPESLKSVFSGPLVRDPDDTRLHDSICGA